ncbi:MAG: redoxin domain-containing protein [Planctomycetes bacterium]|nr:redoxin domain-containing protein [Planctomycetota bacterium]MCP4771894.1 redoxin domain-containing protein [Planctomycetota bacterium]MCP4861944.1 redoxin domain-containing protein [Planctomycetota bacterium]
MLLPLLGCSSAASIPETGEPFPEFALASHDGRTITNADLLGNTSVIWFYPKASTPG